jgi:hypothetical protein
MMIRQWKKHVIPASNQEPVSSSQLLPLAYEELRRLARGQMAGESGSQTISATVLLQEAWPRVSRDAGRGEIVGRVCAAEKYAVSPLALSAAPPGF